MEGWKKGKSRVGGERFIFFPMGGRRATKTIREFAYANADFPRFIMTCSFPPV
jgi:hypothetical protein